MLDAKELLFNQHQKSAASKTSSRTEEEWYTMLAAKKQNFVTFNLQEITHLGRLERPTILDVKVSLEAKERIIQSKITTIQTVMDYVKQNPKGIIVFEGLSQTLTKASLSLTNLIESARAMFPQGLPQRLDEYTISQKEFLWSHEEFDIMLALDVTPAFHAAIPSDLSMELDVFLNQEIDRQRVIFRSEGYTHDIATIKAASFVFKKHEALIKDLRDILAIEATDAALLKLHWHQQISSNKALVILGCLHDLLPLCEEASIAHQFIHPYTQRLAREAALRRHMAIEQTLTPAEISPLMANYVYHAPRKTSQTLFDRGIIAAGITYDEMLLINGMFHHVIRSLSETLKTSHTDTELIEICKHLENVSILPKGLHQYLSPEIEARYLDLKTVDPEKYSTMQPTIEALRTKFHAKPEILSAFVDAEMNLNASNYADILTLQEIPQFTTLGNKQIAFLNAIFAAVYYARPLPFSFEIKLEACQYWEKQGVFPKNMHVFVNLDAMNRARDLFLNDAEFKTKVNAAVESVAQMIGAKAIEMSPVLNKDMPWLPGSEQRLCGSAGLLDRLMVSSNMVHEDALLLHGLLRELVPYRDMLGIQLTANDRLSLCQSLEKISAIPEGSHTYLSGEIETQYKQLAIGHPEQYAEIQHKIQLERDNYARRMSLKGQANIDKRNLKFKHLAESLERLDACREVSHEVHEIATSLLISGCDLESFTEALAKSQRFAEFIDADTEISQRYSEEQDFKSYIDCLKAAANNMPLEQFLALPQTLLTEAYELSVDLFSICKIKEIYLNTQHVNLKRMLYPGLNMTDEIKAQTALLEDKVCLAKTENWQPNQISTLHRESLNLVASIQTYLTQCGRDYYQPYLNRYTLLQLQEHKDLQQIFDLFKANFKALEAANWKHPALIASLMDIFDTMRRIEINSSLEIYADVIYYQTLMHRVDANGETYIRREKLSKKQILFLNAVYAQALSGPNTSSWDMNLEACQYWEQEGIFPKYMHAILTKHDCNDADELMHSDPDFHKKVLETVDRISVPMLAKGDDVFAKLPGNTPAFEPGAKLRLCGAPGLLDRLFIKTSLPMDDALVLSGVLEQIIPHQNADGMQVTRAERFSLCNYLEIMNNLPLGSSAYLANCLDTTSLRLELQARINNEMDNYLRRITHQGQCNVLKRYSQYQSLIKSLNQLKLMPEFNQEIADILETLKANGCDLDSYTEALEKTEKFAGFIQANQEITDLWSADRNFLFYESFITTNIYNKINVQELLTLPQQLLDEARGLSLDIGTLCNRKNIACYLQQLTKTEALYGEHLTAATQALTTSLQVKLQQAIDSNWQTTKPEELYALCWQLEDEIFTITKSYDRDFYQPFIERYQDNPALEQHLDEFKRIFAELDNDGWQNHDLLDEIKRSFENMRKIELATPAVTATPKAFFNNLLGRTPLSATTTAEHLERLEKTQSAVVERKPIFGPLLGQDPEVKSKPNTKLCTKIHKETLSQSTVDPLSTSQTTAIEAHAISKAFIITGGSLSLRLTKVAMLLAESTLLASHVLTHDDEIALLFAENDAAFQDMTFQQAKEIAGSVQLGGACTISQLGYKKPPFGIMDLTLTYRDKLLRTLNDSPFVKMPQALRKPRLVTQVIHLAGSHPMSFDMTASESDINNIAESFHHGVEQYRELKKHADLPFVDESFAEDVRQADLNPEVVNDIKKQFPHGIPQKFSEYSLEQKQCAARHSLGRGLLATGEIDVVYAAVDDHFSDLYMNLLNAEIKLETQKRVDRWVKKVGIISESIKELMYTLALNQVLKQYSYIVHGAREDQLLFHAEKAAFAHALRNNAQPELMDHYNDHISFKGRIRNIFYALFPSRAPFSPITTVIARYGSGHNLTPRFLLNGVAVHRLDSNTESFDYAANLIAEPLQQSHSNIESSANNNTLRAPTTALTTKPATYAKQLSQKLSPQLLNHKHTVDPITSEASKASTNPLANIRFVNAQKLNAYLYLDGLLQKTNTLAQHLNTQDTSIKALKERSTIKRKLRHITQEIRQLTRGKITANETFELMIEHTSKRILRSNIRTLGHMHVMWASGEAISWSINQALAYFDIKLNAEETHIVNGMSHTVGGLLAGKLALNMNVGTLTKLAPWFALSHAANYMHQFPAASVKGRVWQAEAQIVGNLVRLAFAHLSGAMQGTIESLVDSFKLEQKEFTRKDILDAEGRVELKKMAQLMTYAYELDKPQYLITKIIDSIVTEYSLSVKALGTSFNKFKDNMVEYVTKGETPQFRTMPDLAPKPQNDAIFPLSSAMPDELDDFLDDTMVDDIGMPQHTTHHNPTVIQYQSEEYKEACDLLLIETEQVINKEENESLLPTHYATILSHLPDGHTQASLSQRSSRLNTHTAARSQEFVSRAGFFAPSKSSATPTTKEQISYDKQKTDFRSPIERQAARSQELGCGLSWMSSSNHAPTRPTIETARSNYTGSRDPRLGQLLSNSAAPLRLSMQNLNLNQESRPKPNTQGFLNTLNRWNTANAPDKSLHAWGQFYGK